MSGTNGNGGDDEYNGEETPSETPQATLAVHRPYVLALASVIAPLHETVHMLSEVMHEFRIAKEPKQQSLIDKIRDAGTAIKGVGQTIETEFGR